jgi:hypothetical protein
MLRKSLRLALSLIVLIALPGQEQPTSGQPAEPRLRISYEPLVGDTATSFTAAVQNFSWDEMVLVEVSARNELEGQIITLRGVDDLLAVGPRRRANVTFTPDGPGPWVVQARGATLDGTPLSADSTLWVASPGATTGEISLGQTVPGSVRQWDEGNPGFGTWALRGQADTTVALEVQWPDDILSMTQRAFGRDIGGIVLMNSQGDELASDLDYIPSLALPEDGLYFIVVYAYGDDVAYHLSLQDGAGTPGAGGAINFGRTVTGLIEPAGSQQEWFFSAQAGEVVQITMRAPGHSRLDSELDLYNPQGQLVANNDDYYGSDSHIVYVVPQAGDYRIVARSHNGNSSGVYRLSLVRGESAGSGQRLDMNRSTAGNVSQGGAEAWQFEGRGGQQVTIRVDALDATFDPYLILYGPNGNEIGRDDDGGDGLNSRLVVNLPENGIYTISVSSYDGSAGRYVVRVTD